jgi:RNA polymerase sigma factor (sigma-70 family)
MALMLSTSTFSPVCSEGELIEAARDGDDRAFEELYARYGSRIVAFIRNRVRDQGRVEDVSQEVFISALRRLRASDQEIAFKPWIYEIAKNACIDEHRREVRSQEISLDADADLAGGQRALLSVAPTPPAAVEGKQRLADLRGAFGGLSKSHHELLVMREFEGLSYDEIGARTGMSRQMVESALFRARRKLSEEYDELASGRRCQQVQSAIDSGRLLSPRKLGVRERRQFARHLAHCQTCRLSARMTGVDQSLVIPRRGLGAKIAALLPFPLLPWKLRGGQSAPHLGLRSSDHPGTLQTLQAVAATGGEPIAGAGTALGGAVVAVAALALAGAGSGVPAHAGHHATSAAGLITVRRAAYAVPSTGAAAAMPPILPASRPTTGLRHAGAGRAGLGSGTAARPRSIAVARRRTQYVGDTQSGHSAPPASAPAPEGGPGLPDPVRSIVPTGPGSVTSGAQETVGRIVQIPGQAINPSALAGTTAPVRTVVHHTLSDLDTTSYRTARKLRHLPNSLNGPGRAGPRSPSSSS